MKVRFNGVRLDEGFDVLVTSRPLPDFKASTTSIDGVHGEQFDSLALGTRECEVQLIAPDKGRDRLQFEARRLGKVLMVDEPKWLVFGDERDKEGNQLHRKAVPTGVPSWEEFMEAGRLTVRFLQPDPFLYGKDRTAIINPNEKVKVRVGGNAPAWPVFRTEMTAPATYVLQNMGEGMHLKYRPVRECLVRVNMRSHKVFEDELEAWSVHAGTTPNYTGEGLALGSRFWSVEGRVNLKANCVTKMTWTERWL